MLREYALRQINYDRCLRRETGGASKANPSPAEIGFRFHLLLQPPCQLPLVFFAQRSDLSRDDGKVAGREAAQVEERARRCAAEGASECDFHLGCRHWREAHLEQEPSRGGGIKKIGRVGRAREGEGV